jgi:MFS family permease
MNEETAKKGRARRAHAASWWTAAVAFLGGIGGGVVFPILPSLGQRLGLPALVLGLILSANRITRIVFNPVTGMLIDRFGGKWPVAIGLIIEAVAILSFVIALHSAAPAAWFLSGRVVWGVGSSLLMVGAMAAVLAVSGQDDRGRVVARVRSAISLGLPAGLLVGGVVADVISAEAAFYCAMGLSLAGAACALLGVPAGGQQAQSPSASGDGVLGRVFGSFMREP